MKSKFKKFVGIRHFAIHAKMLGFALWSFSTIFSVSYLYFVVNELYKEVIGAKLLELNVDGEYLVDIFRPEWWLDSTLKKCILVSRQIYEFFICLLLQLAWY